MAQGPLSLKGRALRWLAQREHSREELARKLLRHLAAERRAARRAPVSPGERPEAQDAGALANGVLPAVAQEPGTGLRAPDRASAVDPAGATSAAHAPDAPTAAEDRQRIDAALDALEVRGLLSDARAAQSLVISRASRHGSRRLRQDLQAKGLAPELIDRALASVADSEFDRARQLWQRRFGQAPLDLRERARQTRFLLGRGFAADLIRRVMAEARHAADPSDGAGWSDEEDAFPAETGADEDGIARGPGEAAGDGMPDEPRSGTEPVGDEPQARHRGRQRLR
jgi:regulatory protein